MPITALDAHVGGAAVRLVTSGLPQLDATTMAGRRRRLDELAGDLLLGLTREPRGHAGMVGVVLTEPDRAEADAGMLFFTGAGPRPLSGHAAMAASALALDHHLVAPRVEGRVTLDTEAGEALVEVVSRGREGEVRRVRFLGPPASVLRGNVRLTAARRGLRADLAWSGSEAVAIVEGEALGVPLSTSHTLDLRRAALEVLGALAETVVLTAPGSSGSAQVSACVLVGPATDPGADVRSVLVRDDGTVARSPSASGTAAVAVVLAAMGVLAPGGTSRHESLSGASWTAQIASAGVEPDGATAVAITGDVYPIGVHTFLFAEGDPLPYGVRWA
jgi:proline racemase